MKVTRSLYLVFDVLSPTSAVLTVEENGSELASESVHYGSFLHETQASHVGFVAKSLINHAEAGVAL